MRGALWAARTALYGALCIAAADIFRAAGRAGNFRGAARIGADFFSIVSAGAVLWYGMLNFADGSVRFCVLISAAAGAFLYVLTVRKLFFRLLCAVFKKIFTFLHLILKILLTPTRFLYKMIYVRIYTKRCGNGDESNAEKSRHIPGKAFQEK